MSEDSSNKRYPVKGFFSRNIGWILGGFLLLCFLAAFAYSAVMLNYKIAIIYVMIPFAVIFLMISFYNYKIFAFFIFIYSYLFCNFSILQPWFKTGVGFDFLLYIFISILLLDTIFVKRKINWSYSRTPALLLSVIWFIYTLLLLFNPVSRSTQAWFTSVRWTSVYMLLIILFVPIVLEGKKEIRIFFNALAVLTILGALTAIRQKIFGFNRFEWTWLYAGDHYRTHIINTGIRYFSFFTDAANFGTSMGLSFVVFAILGFSEVKTVKKIFYFVTMVLSFIGFLLSGTRSAIAIIIVGIATFVIIVKNSKYIISLGSVMIAGVLLLMFTNVGNGNQYIRRMRTAFDSEDASFQVRVMHHAEMRKYMKGHLFGVGIGLAGGKALRYVPDSSLAQIPTDSWLYSLWIETGIVGLSLYLLIMLAIIFYGAYCSFFRLKDKVLRRYNNIAVSVLAGILVTSYANEVLAQFPNGIIVFICISIIFITVRLDKEQEQEKIIT